MSRSRRAHRYARTGSATPSRTRIAALAAALAVVAATVFAGAAPAQAAAGDASAYGVEVAVSGGAVGTLGTGPLVIASTAGPTTNQGSPVVGGSNTGAIVSIPGLTTQAQHDTSTGNVSSSAVAQLPSGTLDDASTWSAPTIGATCSADQNGVTGSAQVSGFNITYGTSGVTVGANPAPNTTIPVNLPGGGKAYLTFNEQTRNADGSLTVTGLHIRVDSSPVTGTGDIYIASATCGPASAPQAAPAITQQPANATAVAGDAVAFSVTATGTPAPTYQWQVDQGAGFSNIAGATSATYTVPAATTGQNGDVYRVVVSNSVGTATSNSATLTVTAPTPAPTVTAVGPVSGPAAGGTTVTVVGKGFTGATAVTFGGVTASSFTVVDDLDITAVTPAFTVAAGCTGPVDVAVTTPAGTGTGAAAYTYQACTPPAFTTQPQSTTTLSGMATLLVVAVSGSPTPTIQWQVDDGAWADITGATGATFLTATAGDYRAVATNGVSPDAISDVATVSVLCASPFCGLPPITPPVITQQPVDVTVPEGADAVFTAAATGATGADWESSTNGQTWYPVAGATSGTLTVPAVSASDDGIQYHVSFTNAAGRTYSSIATLQVVTKPTISLDVSGTLGDNGWYTSPVVITPSCDLGAYAGIAGGSCDTARTVNTDGADQGLMFGAANLAGDAFAPISVSVDQTPPTVSLAGVTDGATVASKPTPTCVAADVTSGLASCTIAETSGADGRVTFTATAKDKAGNTATTSATVTVFAKPTVSVTLDGTLGDNGWYVSPVTPVPVCDLGGDPRGMCAASTLFDQDGADQSYPVGAHNAVGDAEQTVTFSIDQTPPTVALAGVTDGATLSSKPTPTCAAADATSGLASCAIAETTGAGGTVTFTATAKDKAGNTATTSATVTVKEAVVTPPPTPHQDPPRIVLADGEKPDAKVTQGDTFIWDFSVVTTGTIVSKVVSAPASGSAKIVGDPQLVFASSATGVQTMVVTVTDDLGQTATQTFTADVTAAAVTPTPPPTTPPVDPTTPPVTPTTPPTTPATRPVTPTADPTGGATSTPTRAPAGASAPADAAAGLATTGTDVFAAGFAAAAILITGLILLVIARRRSRSA